MLLKCITCLNENVLIDECLTLIGVLNKHFPIKNRTVLSTQTLSSSFELFAFIEEQSSFSKQSIMTLSKLKIAFLSVNSALTNSKQL